MYTHKKLGYTFAIKFAFVEILKNNKTSIRKIKKQYKILLLLLLYPTKLAFSAPHRYVYSVRERETIQNELIKFKTRYTQSTRQIRIHIHVYTCIIGKLSILHVCCNRFEFKIWKVFIKNTYIHIPIIITVS